MFFKQLVLSSLVAFLVLTLRGVAFLLIKKYLLDEWRFFSLSSSLYHTSLPELAVSAVALSALYLYTAPRRLSLFHGALFGTLAGLLVLSTHRSMIRASLKVLLEAGSIWPRIVVIHVANMASWAAAGLLVAWVSRKIDARHRSKAAA